MRPAGEIRVALLQAACDLVTSDSAPTLRELATRACVGNSAALHTVRNMVRSGDLRIARPRCVEYRNRPVAEYEPAKRAQIRPDEGFVDVASVFSVWAQG